jgi:type III secretion system YscD/HrpQ family protein
MAGYLIAEEGPLAGLIVRFEEGDEWILGRDADEVDILLEDPMVSRKHVICRHTAEGYILENLSSVNPATQNGKVITDSVLLREGDILQIGSTFFRFTEQPMAPEMTVAPDEQALSDLSSVSVESITEARWVLKVIAGPNSGAEFALHRGASYIVGKDPHLCDIVFQDLSVSRQHARLSVDEDNRVFIEDLGSRNGVLINGALSAGKTPVAPQDLIALGTTSFLVIDREQVQETIISPPTVALGRVEEEGAKETARAAPRDWRDTIIPTRHLIIAGALGIAVIAGCAALLALFKSKPVSVHVVDETAEIKKALSSFPGVQFSYNPANGKVFLIGHVLTSVDKQELLYKIHNVPFIQAIEDTVVVDELVWENMNALLMTNPNWVGVSIHSPEPGKFVLRGYVQSLDIAQALADYINLNFPYLDRLDNQIVVETNLQTQVQSILIEKGFSGVTFQLSNGELVLAGRVDQKHAHPFDSTVDHLKALKGIRSVKNFVIYTAAESSRIDVSSQYAVSGYSKKDDHNLFIVINGKILKLGDTIDGMLVTEIMPTMVLLEKDGLKFRINYNLQ